MDALALSARVRLVDVAARAGVTKSVASRVLNGDPTLSVRPDTRRRVWAAASELRYRPHSGAQALAGAQAGALALLIPDLTNPVYARIIRGAYQRAREHGYVVMLSEDTADHAADEAFTELVDAGRVDGLLIASARPRHRLLQSRDLSRMPHVFVNREVPGSGRNVGMNLVAASACAVEHLHGLGHQRIGHVAGPQDLFTAQARERGFLQAMGRCGLEVAPVERGAFSEEGGDEAADRLLDAHPEITAIYVSILTQAVGVLHAARRRGRRVPEELSVIAYDDLALARFLEPPLTTIAMPLQSLGATSVDALLSQLAGGPPRDHLVDTAPTVVDRESTVQMITVDPAVPRGAST